MMNTQDLIREENHRIRLLRISADLLVQLLMTQRPTVSEAEEMIGKVRNLAMQLFPGKEDVFDLIYLPRFRRALREAGLGDHRAELKVLNGCRGGDEE